ncbi:hypothetical protein PLESTF_001622700 [Pleodorina starrii]|nr:hypothetical protein PLESTF_000803700 [Pleodorina starrii]GLC75312.1 hypothetical protein PLESTF_001622700 [Pleodorina starrii]
MPLQKCGALLERRRVSSHRAGQPQRLRHALPHSRRYDRRHAEHEFVWRVPGRRLRRAAVGERQPRQLQIPIVRPSRVLAVLTQRRLDDLNQPLGGPVCLGMARRGQPMVDEALPKQRRESPLELTAAVGHHFGWGREPGHQLQQAAGRLVRLLAPQGHKLRMLGEMFNAYHDISVAERRSRGQRSRQVNAPAVEHAPYGQRLQLDRARDAAAVGHVAQLAAAHDPLDGFSHPVPPVTQLHQRQGPTYAQVGHRVHLPHDGLPSVGRWADPRRAVAAGPKQLIPRPPVQRGPSEHAPFRPPVGPDPRRRALEVRQR